MTTRPAALTLLVALTFVACAPYAANTLGIRHSLSSGDFDGAFEAVERAAHGPSKLLYFMESGLIAHYDGDYVRSNILLDRAERVSDELFTRSLSRELAALVTSDESRHYRGETYELVFIHYYRALNYWYLNLPEDALVECRKANLKLARYTRNDEDATYRNDAFIHYLTALFYESEGEFNDAYISLKDAESAYRTYAEKLGLDAPDELLEDLARVESELGYAESELGYAESELGFAGTEPTFASIRPRSPIGSGELVVFAELGFIPRKTQEVLNLPIYESDLKHVRSGSVKRVSRQIHRRYGRHGANVDYCVRVAFPVFEPLQPESQHIRIIAGDLVVEPAPAQNLDGIARLTLEEKSGSIFVRTVARALIKLAATKGAEKKAEWLGFLVNMFTASTEKADTRSWVTLPREIRIGRLSLPPGQHTIAIQSLDGSGNVIHETSREVTIRPGKRTFINHRQYG